VERISSPWRLEYVKDGAGALPEGKCVFCVPDGEREDPNRLVLAVYARTLAVLNLFPYTSGHVLLAPRRHVADLSLLDGEELAELMRLAAGATAILREEYGPDGLNLGMNLGKAAGAGIADHLHLHVLPRWVGDTNFMTTVHDTRVLPEALPGTLARLRPKFAALVP
jgi:ATP adenylyltransferase